MSGVIPAPWEFALLALAAFSVWKLIADDRILDRPRYWIFRRIGPESPRAVYWSDFLTCPWCAGFWISGGVYAGFLSTLGEWPSTGGQWAVAIGIWFALRAAVGALGTLYYAVSD